MSFSTLRRQVDALLLKYATKVQIYRLCPHALDLCDEMTEAVTGPITTPPKSVPKSVMAWASDFFRRLREHGLRLWDFIPLADYLDECLQRRVLPQVNNVLRSILPKAAAKGLIPRYIGEPVPFPERPPAN